MWHFIPETNRFYASLAINADPEDFDDSDMCFRQGATPTDEQGRLFADALNVHEATGLTPSQLQARVAELEAALRLYQGYSHHNDAGNTLAAMRHFEEFERELARLLK